MSFLPFLLTHYPKSGYARLEQKEPRWDPCAMWVTYGGYMHNLAALGGFGALVYFMVQGLRSRSGSRWFALAGLLSLVLAVEDMWWQIPCLGTLSAVLMGIWYSSVAMMFLHHAVRPSAQSDKWPQGHRKIAMVYKGVVLALMSVLSAWFAVYQLALMVPVPRCEYAAQIMTTIGRNISLPAHLLLLGALALNAYRRVAWSKIATGEQV